MAVRKVGAPLGQKPVSPIDMQCDPRDPDRIFINNYEGGNFLSEDGGKTWINASTGYSGGQVLDITVNPNNPAHVVAVGRSGGWYSLDGGITWEGLHNPGSDEPVAAQNWQAVAFDPELENHVIVGSDWFLEWLQEENRWEEHEAPQPYGPGTGEIEFAPSNPSIVYAVSANESSLMHAFDYDRGQGVAVSRNGGSSWENITGEDFTEAVITDVAVDPLQSDKLYIASQVGLFMSENGGKNWKFLSDFAPEQPARLIAVKPDDPKKLFVGIPQWGLFTSEDGGETWRSLAAGLEPNSLPRDIVFDPADSSVMYLADISSGVYTSTDAGETWQKINNSLDNRAVVRLAITSDGAHLYAATSGAGVFRLDLDGKNPVYSAIEGNDN